jgi:hypothetical protein
MEQGDDLIIFAAAPDSSFFSLLGVNAGPIIFQLSIIQAPVWPQTETDPSMDIPGLGAVTKGSQFDWYYSQPMPVPVLGGMLCRVVVAGYDEDPRKEEFHSAIANFLRILPSVLKEAEPYVFRYYENCNSYWEQDDEEFVAIESPTDIWRHVQLGNEPMVRRRGYGDKGLYVSLECNCDWEPEHGLQIVFKNGLRVNKIGSYDGHLTNSDAYANDDLEDVVYQEF